MAGIDDSGHSHGTPKLVRQLKELPPFVLMLISVLTFFGLASSVKVLVLSSPQTKTVTVTTLPRTVTVTTSTGSGKPVPNAPARLGWLSDIRDPSNSNFGEVLDQPVTVGGQTYAHTVQLVHANTNCKAIADPSYVSFPVASGATHLSGMFGWTSDSNGSSADLIVYANSLTGEVLWDQSFPNPGLPLTLKHLDKIAGVRAVIFELVGQQCDNGTFVLAETQFTS